MDHQFTGTQEILRKTAADFFARDYPLHRLRDAYQSPDGYDPDLWPAIQRLGWPGAPFPADMGGAGGTFNEAAVILEEMGRGACASPYCHSVIAAGLALLESAPGVAADIATGAATVIPVFPADSAAQPPLEARFSASGTTVSGRSVAVPWANVATHLLVMDGGGRGGLLVPVPQPAVQCARMEALPGDLLFLVDYDGAPAVAIPDPDLPRRVRSLGAAGTALMLLGLSERALELAVSYARERVQFGRPIGSFQAIQHACANMVIEVEVARNLAYKPAWLHAHGRPYHAAASYAKAYLGDVSARVAREAMQIHGGVGFVDNHPVQLPYTIGASLAGMYGTAGEHRRSITDALLGAARR